MAVGKQVGKSSGVSDLTEKDVEFWSLIWWEGVFAFKLVKNRLQDFDPARISQIFLILVSLVSEFCVFRRNPLKISMLAWLWWWKVESFASATSRLWKLYVLERLNSWLFRTTRLLCGNFSDLKKLRLCSWHFNAFIASKCMLHIRQSKNSFMPPSMSAPNELILSSGHETNFKNWIFSFRDF